MAQKFIITNNGLLRFGDVNMHRDLLLPNEDCLGGGMYEFDYISSSMLLSGRSYDFGRPQWGVIDCLYVPKALEGLNITYEEIPIKDLTTVIFL